MIYCRTLGPIEVIIDGGPAPAELLWRKNLALLVYLARSPKRARARDHLLGLLWGERPESAARHSLNEALRVLRKYAGKEAFEGEGGQIRVSGDAIQLDIDDFDSLVSAEDWRAAAELVSGEFMEGFGVPGCSEFEDWLYSERTEWRERSVNVLVAWAGELLGGGEASAAEAAARWALALDSTSAPAQRIAMRSLALAGDRAGALTSYDAFVARLEDEIGIEPDDETRALAERVRRERTWKLPASLAEREEEGAEWRRAPLVGREAELEQLVDAWATCRERARATLAIVEGDPGTGRTRLAEEMLARARLDGAVVAAARAVEADLDEAWSGILALARSMPLEAPGMRSAHGASIASFAAHLPDWAERFGVDTDVAPQVPLGRAAVDVLRAVTAEQPALLLMDDAQWLDRDSLLALGSALRDLEEAPLFIFIAAAPHPTREELDDLRAHIGREVAGLVLRLGPLSADALRALAHWALPTYSDVELDRVARRIATDSAGLPLLVVEMLHAVALGLDLGASPGAWPEPMRTLDQTLPGGLPDAVAAAVRVGFRRLSREAQAVLAAAAALSQRFTARTLERVTDIGPEALGPALDELEWQRWIAADSRGYTFVARIVRDVVARDMLTAGQRGRIVERASEA